MTQVSDILNCSLEGSKAASQLAEGALDTTPRDSDSVVCHRRAAVALPTCVRMHCGFGVC